MGNLFIVVGVVYAVVILVQVLSCRVSLRKAAAQGTEGCYAGVMAEQGCR